MEIERQKLRKKVIKEIEKMPENQLREIHKLLNSFKSESPEKPKKDKILSFAGCWQDLPDDVFKTLMSEISKRRINAFGDRRAV